MSFVAKSPEDLPTQAAVLGMSGLEYMQAIRDGKLPGAPISGLLRFRLDAIEDGQAVFRGMPEFDVTNPAGTVHGGWYGALLDSAMACAVMTRVPKGSVYTTLEYKVNIIRPIPLGMEIVCTGLSDHVGRSTGIAHGEIRGAEDDKLYATGSTTCIVMKI